MNANEYICVDAYEAVTHEDSFETGEKQDVSSSWSNRDNQVCGRFQNVMSALRAVCAKNFFQFRASSWISWMREFGEDPNRFDFSTLVDQHNCEATPSEIEAWKAGRKRLWSCTLTVWLSVRTERDLTPDEVLASI